MHRLLTFALLGMPLAASAQTYAERNTGVWTGSGVQTGEQSWAMTLFLRPDGAVVDYPDLLCSAVWEFLHVGEDDLSAIERLAAGFDLCADGLPLSISIDAKGVMTVFWADAQGAPVASAWLTQSAP